MSDKFLFTERDLRKKILRRFHPVVVQWWIFYILIIILTDVCLRKNYITNPPFPCLNMFLKLVAVNVFT